MSLKRIPGLGKSGMSRMWARKSIAAPASAGSRRDPTQVADEQQVLEVRGDRGEVLERLDRLLAAVGIARAQRRREDLLEQRRLPVRGGAEDTQVATADAEARELRHRTHDLALGVVEEQLALP